MYPQAYIDYLIHFHGDRDYFECHEVLEEYWKKVDSRNKDSILVGFILLAVSNYHHRRSNIAGAKRTLRKALNIFELQADKLPSYGFNATDFVKFIKIRLDEVESNQKYRSINLPLADTSLSKLCEGLCQRKGLVWGSLSDLSNDLLIHKHIRRDRSDVILERKLSMKAKKEQGRQ